MSFIKNTKILNDSENEYNDVVIENKNTKENTDLEKKLYDKIKQLEIALNNKIYSNRLLLKKNNELKIQLDNSFNKIKQLECGEKDTNILSLKEKNDLNRISFNENDKIK